MTWKPGKHACDGPWAKWWYQDVHQSNGWANSDDTTTTINKPKQQQRYRTLNPKYITALRASYSAYDTLRRLSVSYQKNRPDVSKLYEDPRNGNVLVYIGTPGQRGRIVPRDLASISPWDSAVQGGDACWEGLRVYRGTVLHLNKHIKRLLKSSKALGYDPNLMHTADEIKQAVFRVLAANGMRDGAHMRLTLTRGEKYTSSMNPKFNVYGTTLIILPEWKPTEGATTYDNTKGITLITASQRRNSPSTVDSKIHHNKYVKCYFV